MSCIDLDQNHFGLGLGDAKDITVKGLEIVRRAKRVYLEAYTSILTVGKEALEAYYGRKVILADREMVEQASDELMADSDIEDIAFLVVGDPLGATTHTDLILRATEKGIPYHVIHNASIINAIGCCGLQLYNYGEVVSIVFWSDDWKPESFYDKILTNKKRGLHTLCLLDIKMKEQTIENLMKGRPVFEPPRFLSASLAAQQLLEIIRNRKEKCSSALTADSICVAVARVGSQDQKIVAATLEEMSTTDMGTPLHSLVIPGDMHPLERQMLLLFAESEKIKSVLSTEDTS
ncbi:diphthine methyl ester synthase-like isoform X1 [Biomphalaria glabrata]|uniref:diphthine methyl ester synthase n=1 Tax=Biomphalaria glabrata TaxID=6526 RepID=A0A9W3AGP2_BIOGL|nr:diphthine methyl ester synthase-like isoform X1 [Biomphalaria glabrata]